MRYQTQTLSMVIVKLYNFKNKNRFYLRRRPYVYVYDDEATSLKFTLLISCAHAKIFVCVLFELSKFLFCFASIEFSCYMYQKQNNIES